MSTPTGHDGDCDPVVAARERQLESGGSDEHRATVGAPHVEHVRSKRREEGWTRPRSRRHVVRARAQRHTPWPLTAGRCVPAWRARGRRGGHGRQGRRRRAVPDVRPRPPVQVGRGELRKALRGGSWINRDLHRHASRDDTWPADGQSVGVLRQRLPVRPLTAADRDIALAWCARDRPANVFVAARIEEGHCDPTRGPSTLGRRASRWAGLGLGQRGAGRLDEAGVADVAARIMRQRRQCASIFGPSEQVVGLWNRLGPWGPVRAIRGHQPLLATSTRPPPARSAHRPRRPPGASRRGRPGRPGGCAHVHRGDRLSPVLRVGPRLPGQRCSPHPAGTPSSASRTAKSSSRPMWASPSVARRFRASGSTHGCAVRVSLCRRWRPFWSTFSADWPTRCRCMSTTTTSPRVRPTPAAASVEVGAFTTVLL